MREWKLPQFDGLCEPVVGDPVGRTVKEEKLPQFDELCDPVVGVREGNLPQFDVLCDPFVGVSPTGLKAVAPGPATA